MIAGKRTNRDLGAFGVQLLDRGVHIIDGQADMLQAVMRKRRRRRSGLPCSGSSGTAQNFFACRISGVAIFPCEGGRDEDGERALGAAFDKAGAERVTRLYLRDDLPDDQCWLRAPGWCLAYR
jgi:hypothetical protein